jgi:hypothetical protein
MAKPSDSIFPFVFSIPSITLLPLRTWSLGILIFSPNTALKGFPMYQDTRFNQSFLLGLPGGLRNPSVV